MKHLFRSWFKKTNKIHTEHPGNPLAKVGVISHVGRVLKGESAVLRRSLPNGCAQQEFTGVGAGSAEHSEIRWTRELNGSRTNGRRLRFPGAARGASAASGGCFPADTQGGLSPTAAAAALPGDGQPEAPTAPSARGLSQGWTPRPGQRTEPRPKRVCSGGGGRPRGLPCSCEEGRKTHL